MEHNEKLKRSLNYSKTIKEMNAATNHNADVRAIFDRMPYDMPDHRYDNVEESVNYGVE